MPVNPWGADIEDLIWLVANLSRDEPVTGAGMGLVNDATATAYRWLDSRHQGLTDAPAWAMNLAKTDWRHAGNDISQFIKVAPLQKLQNLRETVGPLARGLLPLGTTMADRANAMTGLGELLTRTSMGEMARQQPDLFRWLQPSGERL